MACVPSPTETVFETITATTLISTVTGTSTALVPGQDSEVTIVRTVGANGNNPRTLTQIRTVRGTATETEIPLTGVVTSTVVSSTPVSTLFASCTETTSTTTPITTSTTTSTTTTTSSTTSSSTTTTPSSTTSSTTTTPPPSSSSTTSSATSRSTITEFTTVPASSTSSSGSSASLASSNAGGGSSTPVGAIAGGVVGGIAGLALLALLIWLCCKRKRKDDDKDFFRDDDAWDPAVGTAAVMSQKGSTGTLHRHSRYNSVGGGGSPASGNAYGTALAAGAAGGALGAAATGSRDERRRRTRPSDQQDSYYSSVPQVERYGAATPGEESHAWDHDSYGSHDYNANYPSASIADHGGSTAPVGLASGAGMAGVGAMGGRRQSPLQQQAMRQSYHQRQLSGGASDMHSNQPYTAPGRTSPPFSSGGAGIPASIPYNPASHNDSILPPQAHRFDQRGPTASPAPSHRSIPALGGYAGQDGRRGGPLRVMNEVGEDTEDAYGGSFDPYEEQSLSAGLDRSGSIAPSYRTHAR